MVVLNKGDRAANCAAEFFFVEAFEKEAAVVGEDFWFEEFDVGKRGFDEFHRIPL